MRNLQIPLISCIGNFLLMPLPLPLADLQSRKLFKRGLDFAREDFRRHSTAATVASSTDSADVISRNFPAVSPLDFEFFSSLFNIRSGHSASTDLAPSSWTAAECENAASSIPSSCSSFACFSSRPKSCASSARKAQPLRTNYLAIEMVWMMKTRSRQDRKNVREAATEIGCIEVEGILLEEGIKPDKLSNHLWTEILRSGGTEKPRLDFTVVRMMIQKLQQIGIVDNEVFGRNLSDGRIRRGILGL
jgi:hypothetical protein